MKIKKKSAGAVKVSITLQPGEHDFAQKKAEELVRENGGRPTLSGAIAWLIAQKMNQTAVKQAK